MRGAAYSQKDDKTILEMRARGCSWREIGGAIGRGGDSARMRHNRLKDGNQVEPQESSEFIDNGKTAKLVMVTGRQIENAEDACRFADIDLAIWQIKKQRFKKYEAHSKGPDDEMQVAELISISIDLERIVSKQQQQSFDYLKRCLEKGWRPARIKRKKKKGSHLLEVSLYDHHFAKLCWAPEVSATGEKSENYDTKIASEIYCQAVEDHISDAGGERIEKIMLVVGQDFLNIDNTQNSTERGTPQDTDGRIYKAMPLALLALISAIETMREVAPVEVIYVPGNHGPLTSFCICLAIDQRYKSCSDVTVDMTPFPRKYRRYGVSLIGSTHGHKSKPRDRATLIMREASALGLLDAGVRFIEWHTGHFHQEKQMRLATNEAQGVIERVMPSLSGTDKYHADSGYVMNRRASMSMLWGKETGLERIHYAYAE